MAGSVTLSIGIRNNLLALQNTAQLVKQTQGRLSTGLRVASPVDDATAFFTAKALNDRATDFSGKKDSIDQGVSTLSTALDASNSIDTILRQAKGLVISAKSATGTQISDLKTQFNELRNQINLLAADATYQGLNLVAGTGSKLDVSFSGITSSLLSTSAVDITAGVLGLNIGQAVTTANSLSGVASGTFDVTFKGFSGGNIIGTSVTIVFATGFTFTNGSGQINVGSFNFTVESTGLGATAATTQTFNDGTTFNFVLSTTAGANNIINTTLLTSATLVKDVTGQFVISSGALTGLDVTTTNLDASITRNRSKASVIGSNVALLTTRLDFTAVYVNELVGGAGKLTLADTNAEGANLVALQTRQSLGIQALAFAGQAEAQILQLFGR